MSLPGSLAGAGAVVLFLGTTRELTDGRQTASLDYECYPEMARDEAGRNWKLKPRAAGRSTGCAIVHRVGRVEIRRGQRGGGRQHAHRDAAFEAGQWLIDTLKEVVPIWKKENWADGDSQWVHPGMNIPVDDVNRRAAVVDLTRNATR